MKKSTKKPVLIKNTTDRAILSFEAPVLLSNSNDKKIKSTLFKIGKVSGNKIAVIGFTPEAKAEILNSQNPFNIEHGEDIAGKVEKISFNEQSETYEYDAKVHSKVAELVKNKLITGSSWEGYAQKVDGSWVTKGDLAQATEANPIFAHVASMTKIGFVLDPAHKESALLLTNALKEDEEETQTEPEKSSAFSNVVNRFPAPNPNLDSGRPSAQELKNFMNKNVRGGEFGSKQQYEQEEKMYLTNARQKDASKRAGDLIKNALVSSTTGITIKQEMPEFLDFAQGGTFLSDFCNFQTGLKDYKYTSISSNQLLAEQMLNENGTATTGDNTYNDGTLQPRSRISFVHDVSNTELKIGAIDLSSLSQLMMKNLLRKGTKIALTGNNVVSPIIRGIANDASITPTTGNATWIINDFNKARRNKPYTQQGKFMHVIGFSDFIKLQDYLITLGNGFTPADQNFMWTGAFNEENDYAIIGNAVSNPVCVLNDDVIVPASNLQSRYYGNFKALGVQFLGSPELIVDPYTKASTNTTVLTLTVEMDARVANVNQIGYMTGVNVA